jgi:hypothetical protein
VPTARPRSERRSEKGHRFTTEPTETGLCEPVCPPLRQRFGAHTRRSSPIVAQSVGDGLFEGRCMARGQRGSERIFPKRRAGGV